MRTKDDDKILEIYYRSLREQENEINELREKVFELTKDQIRLDWLLCRAYTVQVERGELLTSRLKIDQAIEEEMREKEAGNHI